MLRGWPVTVYHRALELNGPLDHVLIRAGPRSLQSAVRLDDESGMDVRYGSPARRGEGSLPNGWKGKGGLHTPRREVRPRGGNGGRETVTIIHTNP